MARWGGTLAPVEALFLPDGDDLIPTEVTRGPWRPDAQHGGPPAALLGWGVHQRAAAAGGEVARIGVELVRPVPLVPLRLSTVLESVSRRVSHAAATLNAGDEVVATARALVLHVSPVEPVEEPAACDLPGDEAARTAPGWAIDDGVAVYHRDAVEHWFASGDFTQPGPAVDWVRLKLPLVAGAATPGLCRVLAVADFGSGISALFDADTGFGLINADLTVALHRQPGGDWIRLDARTRLGPSGVGLCTTALADSQGPIGTATQSLLPLNVAGAR